MATKAKATRASKRSESADERRWASHPMIGRDVPLYRVPLYAADGDEAWNRYATPFRVVREPAAVVRVLGAYYAPMVGGCGGWLMAYRRDDGSIGAAAVWGTATMAQVGGDPWDQRVVMTPGRNLGPEVLVDEDYPSTVAAVRRAAARLAR